MPTPHADISLTKLYFLIIFSFFPGSHYSHQGRSSCVSGLSNPIFLGSFFHAPRAFLVWTPIVVVVSLLQFPISYLIRSTSYQASWPELYCYSYTQVIIFREKTSLNFLTLRTR